MDTATNAGASEMRLRVALLLALVLVGACGGNHVAPSPPSAISELEQLGFVREGRSLLASGARAGASEISLGEPLLVGMYEVTRDEFRAFLAVQEAELDPLIRRYFEPGSRVDGSLPASFVTREEAALYANWAGMRLLTSQEWLFCALSPWALAYPWADSWQQGRANTLELGLAPYAPTSVGTFEGGRTATHLYDMLGNVWEWVSDELAQGSEQPTNAAAFGGSYLYYKREMHLQGTFFAQSLPPGARFEDLGFRICAPARAWLNAHAAELGRNDSDRARLWAVGRRFGPSAVPLLTELSASVPAGSARRALEALLGGARG